MAFLTFYLYVWSLIGFAGKDFRTTTTFGQFLALRMPRLILTRNLWHLHALADPLFEHSSHRNR